MKFESFHDVLTKRTGTAFDRAMIDARDEARSVAGRHSRTGKFARSIVAGKKQRTGTRTHAHIGSPLASARTKEKGAYVQAKRGPYLVFQAGGSVRRVTAVRLPAQPAVAPVGHKWTRIMGRRLRELAR